MNELLSRAASKAAPRRFSAEQPSAFSIFDFIAADPNIAPAFKRALALETAEDVAEREAEEQAELDAIKREEWDEVLRERQDAERARYGWGSGE